MKRIGAMLALTGLLAMLAGCAAPKTAALRVTSQFTTDLQWVDPDAPEVTVTEPPEVELFTVRAGDKICCDTIRIVKVTDRELTLDMDWPYYGNAYRNEERVRSYEAGERFTLRRGELLVVDEAGLCDASHTIRIEWIE